MKKLFLPLALVLIAAVAYFGFKALRAHNPFSKAQPGITTQGAKPDLLLLQTRGRIIVKDNATAVLESAGKGSDYILEGPLVAELIKNKNREFEVIGKVVPINPVIIDSKSVQAKIIVMAFGDNLIPEYGTSAISAPLLEIFQQKIDAKMQLRKQLMKKFRKDDTFDLAKGMIVKESREVPGKGGFEHITLKTNDGETFLLTGRRAKTLLEKFTQISASPIVILGKETLPDKAYKLNIGEITFDVTEAYTASLDPIK